MENQMDSLFPEMQRCSTIEGIIEWIEENSALLYENGASKADCPLEPLWEFETISVTKPTELGGKHSQYGLLTLDFTIRGSDPYGVIDYMFEDTAIDLTFSSFNWGRYTMVIRLYRDDWPALFVREALVREP